MEPEGDASAQPMIRKYKIDNGHYPETLMKLIPDYLNRYDFQAFIYQHHLGRGKDLDAFIKKELILKGQDEGYSLTVRFQQYTEECTFVNGKRKSCRYIGVR